MKRSQHHRRRLLPLRLRLAIWSAGLVFFLSCALVIFVNVQAALTFPSIIKDTLSCNHQKSCSQLSTFPEKNINTKKPVMNHLTWVEKHPIAGLFSIQTRIYASGSQTIALILSKNLEIELSNISLIGLGAITLSGGLGAYLLTGIALRPLRHINETARHIRGNTLNTRLALLGPRDEVKELADTIDTMLGRLEQAFEVQHRFVADVSHELRTPLASLRTNLEIVSTDTTATIEDYQQMVASQERALTRLECLVSDLLLLSTSEQPPIREQTSLVPIIEETLDTMQTLTHQYQVELTFSYTTDIEVPGEDMLLSRVFSNLIENAICYNHPGGRVDITLMQQYQQAIVTIADTGIGIPSAQQTRIFDRFYRVDSSRSRHRGGAGLGLSLVKTIVQQHNGQIDVKSTPGTGSVFTVQLPLWH